MDNNSSIQNFMGVGEMNINLNTFVQQLNQNNINANWIYELCGMIIYNKLINNIYCLLINKNIIIVRFERKIKVEFKTGHSLFRHCYNSQIKICEW